MNGGSVDPTRRRRLFGSSVNDGRTTPAPPIQRDLTRLVEVTVRPRRLLVVASFSLFAVLVGVFTKLSYDLAYFDPRVLLLAFEGILLLVFGLRARLQVADGALWRRAVVRESGVDLADLAGIEVRRSRLSRSEGAFRTIVVVSDRGGRQITFKPLTWRGGGRGLLAGLAELARRQSLTLDERTIAALGRAVARNGGTPTWAYTIGSRRRPDADAALKKSSFWIRRDEYGRPRRAQAQLLVPILAAGAVGLVAAFGLARAGTSIVRTMRCDADRSAWTAPEASSVGTMDLRTLAAALAAPGTFPGRAKLFRLDSAGIANRYNSAAVQRDAERLARGYDMEWESGGQVRGQLSVEDFATAEDAVRFQHDWGEDHCHKGDEAFPTNKVPGGVGFRYLSSTELADERVAFVRGTLRLQATTYDVPARLHHSAVLQLADNALHVLTTLGSPRTSKA